MNLADKIQQLRKKSDLSQEQLADRLEYPDSQSQNGSLSNQCQKLIGLCN